MGFFGWFKQEKQEPKLCKDCKHMVPDTTFNWESHQVRHAKCAASGVEVCAVDGSVSIKDSCYVQRDLSWRCGPKGKYFQPKENQ